MIVAIIMAKDEAETIGSIVDHLYANKVDKVIVEDGNSTDGTYEIARDHGAVVVYEKEAACYQELRMVALAETFARPGDWVIPVDADEWWVAPGSTLAEKLNDCQAPKMWAPMFLHRDWEHRRPEQKPLMKVCFRWEPGISIGVGAHTVTVPGLDAWGPIEIREIQYRSWEHFLAKIDKTRTFLANTPGLDPQTGTHMKALVAMTPDELEAEWGRMQDGPWVYDPIPT